jgi:CheY-like chemotaxis protein
LQNNSESPVVVVDDDHDDLSLTATLLSKVAGVSRLIQIADAEHAVDFLSDLERSGPDYPRAIVLDVKMPGMTGLDLLQWIREHHVFDRVPVIMWSSSDDPRDIERAARLGAQCYVGKYPPVPAVEEMFKAIDKWHGLDSADRFFRMRCNLFSGCDALPDFVRAPSRDRPEEKPAAE